jgi:phospholipid/cholesterol/gamma-HCH transport system ATP-binding protein
MIQFDQVGFNDGSNRVFGDLSFELQRGSGVLIVGRSGTGKTVLLKLIAGLLDPSEGAIRVAGEALVAGAGPGQIQDRARLSMSFNRGGLVSNITLRENIALPLLFREPISRSEVNDLIDTMAADFRPSPNLEDRPAQATARDRRLCNLLRTVLFDPEIYLFDEPLDELDERDRRWTLGLLAQVLRSPTATVIITANSTAHYRELKLPELHFSEGTLVEGAQATEAASP